MDCLVLTNSTLFSGMPEDDVNELLRKTPHQIMRYGKEETVFHMMDNADRIGILLGGRVEAQKSFPNGSQVNVSVRGPGELIGHAAAFSSGHRFPCDIVALEPVTVMMVKKEHLLVLLQKDVRILENFITEISSTTYMLQQRLELLSYKGIAQKAAFWLLMEARRTSSQKVRIPDSISRWAMLMNVSRPSLHRELKHLADQRIITYSPPIIEIRNRNALQDVLSQ